MRTMVRWTRSMLVAGALLGVAAPAALAKVYTWNPEKSDFRILTDRGGFFGKMGHRHVIRAQQFTGTVEWDPALPEAARIDLVIDAKSLKVIDDDLEPDDVAKVQKDMETKVLEVAKHPEIHFLSNVATVRESSEGRWTLDVGGTLALHGVSQAVVVPLTVSMQNESLRLQGETVVRQKDYEIEPISVGMGAVTVKNEVKIAFDLVAEAPLEQAPPEPAAVDSTSSPQNSSGEAR